MIGLEMIRLEIIGLETIGLEMTRLETIGSHTNIKLFINELKIKSLFNYLISFFTNVNKAILKSVKEIMSDF